MFGELSYIVDTLQKHSSEEKSAIKLLINKYEQLGKMSSDKQFLSNSYKLFLELPILDRYGEKPNDTWFDGEAEQSEVSRENTIRFKLQVIKVESYRTKIFLNSYLIKVRFNQIGHTLLFHGARQASSVDDILRNGIILKRSRKRLDFSNGCGFYLSDEYEAAEEWIKKRKSGASAILIYRVPDKLLAIGATMGADLNTNRDLWSRVVRYYRRNVRHGQDKFKTVLNSSFLKGPVCGNGAMIRKRKDETPIALRVSGKEFQQYCIRSQQLAQKISSLVVGVVIYS